MTSSFDGYRIEYMAEEDDRWREYQGEGYLLKEEMAKVVYASLESRIKTPLRVKRMIHCVEQNLNNLGVLKLEECVAYNDFSESKEKIVPRVSMIRAAINTIEISLSNLKKELGVDG